MPQSVHEGDHRFTGAVIPKQIIYPAASISNAAISPGAAIDATKVVHQFPITVELFGGGVEVEAVDRIVHIARGAGTVVGVQAHVGAAATGEDRTVTVDIERGNSSTAFATILSATADFDDDSTPLEAAEGTIDDGDYVAGDSLQISVAVAGASGDQAEGLTVTIWLRESAD